MNDDDECWDLAAIDELEKLAQQTCAARKATQSNSSMCFSYTAPTANHALASSSAPWQSTCLTYQTQHRPSHPGNFGNEADPLATAVAAEAEAAAAVAECERLRKTMAEKDGAISLLRSRLHQADQELYELRDHMNVQSATQPARQQQELERLSSQLMFKEQEILEFKRACMEKEEKLKTALKNASKWQEEVQALKEERQIMPAGGKRPRQEVKLEKGQIMSCSNGSSVVPKARAFDHTGSSPILKGASSDVAQAHQLAPRDTSASVPAEQPQYIKASEELGKQSRANFVQRMQNTWSSTDSKTCGSNLMKTIFAACEAELYMLLRMDDLHRCRERPSHSFADIKVGINEDSAAFKLHHALTLVAGGNAVSSDLIEPLIELCSFEDHQITHNALYIIRCILQHDPTCLEDSTRRDQVGDLGACLPPGGQCNDLQKSKVVTQGEKWSLVSSNDLPCASSSVEAQKGASLHFESPRIIYHSPMMQRNADGTSRKLGLTRLHSEAGEIRGEEMLEKVQRFDSKQKSADAESARSIFLTWLLKLAFRSLDVGVKFEAMALISLIILQTEPVVQRAQYSGLLFSKEISSLLKRSAGLDVQIETVRALRLLLHCDDVFCKLCDLVEKCPMDIDDPRDSNVEERLNLEMSNAPTSTSNEVLESLADCLMQDGISTKDYALRRSVLRTFMFLGSRESGISILFDGIGTKKLIRDRGKELEHVIANNGGQGVDGKGVNKDAVNNTKPMAEQGKSGSLVWRLITMIHTELRNVEEDQRNSGSRTDDVADERTLLIYEALTLLCRLVLYPSYCTNALLSLTKDRETVRLTLNAITKLISMGPHLRVSRQCARQPTNLTDLSRTLKNRILTFLRTMPNN